jgi:hypothetical protein
MPYTHLLTAIGVEMLSKLKTRLRALLRKSKMERELDEELRYHIDQQTEQNIRLGIDPEEAHHNARKAFGGVEQAKERSRDARGMRWLEELWQDLRYGANVIQAQRLHARRRIDPGAGHWGQHGGIKRGERRAVASVAISQCG